MDNRKVLAFLMVFVAAVSWAGSGMAAQEFFRITDCDAMRLTNIRMILAGLLLMPLAWMKGGLQRSWKVLKERPGLWMDIGIYAVGGILLMQYTYFQGISIGNAAATTVICYTCPAMVICYDSVHQRRWPRPAEIMSVLLAIGGIFLMVTGGDLDSFSVPLACVAWSLVSAVFFSFSAIYPKHLLLELDQVFLLSVGMLFGGICSFLLVPEIDWSIFFRPEVFGLVAYIILGGTALAFLLFNAGLFYLTPEEATVTGAAEPAAAVILSSVIFGTVFGYVELLGIAMVLGAILLPLVESRKDRTASRKKHAVG